MSAVIGMGIIAIAFIIGVIGLLMENFTVVGVFCAMVLIGCSIILLGMLIEPIIFEVLLR